MRVLLVALALLLVPMAATASSSTLTKAYMGTAIRDPLLGPHPVCDVQGNTNIGGACFDLTDAFVAIRVSDGISHGPELVVYSVYADQVGLPIDGATICLKNGGTFYPSHPHGATRLVIAIAPVDETEGFSVTGPNCSNFPGTSGTITMTTY